MSAAEDTKTVVDAYDQAGVQGNLPGFAPTLQPTSRSPHPAIYRGAAPTWARHSSPRMCCAYRRRWISRALAMTASLPRAATDTRGRRRASHVFGQRSSGRTAAKTMHCQSRRCQGFTECGRNRPWGLAVVAPAVNGNRWFT